MSHAVTLPRSLALRQCAMIGAAFAGGWLFSVLHIPAPWLSGALAASALLAAGGYGAPLIAPLRDLAMLLSGITLGTAVRPETLHAFETMPLSIAALGLTTLAIIIGTAFVLVRVLGWHRRDAILAAAPGSLSTTLSIAASEGADVSRIAIVQLVRLVMLIAVLPSVIVSTGLSGVPALASAPLMTASDLALVLALGLFGSLLMERWKFAAPFILGPMLFIGVVRGAGFVEGLYPPIFSTLGFILIGAFIGGRFEGLRRRDIVSVAPAALLSFAVSSAIAFTGAWIVAELVDLPAAEVIISFAPGGLEAMTALAFALHVDPVIVGTHHLLRFMLIGIGLPLVMRLRPSLIRGRNYFAGTN